MWRNVGCHFLPQSWILADGSWQHLVHFSPWPQLFDFSLVGPQIIRWPLKLPDMLFRKKCKLIFCKYFCHFVQDPLMASSSGIEFGCRTIWFDLIGIGNLANLDFLKTKNHISNFKASKIFAHVWSENWEMQKWKFLALVFWCLVILIKMSNLTHFHDKVKMNIYRAHQ